MSKIPTSACLVLLIACPAAAQTSGDRGTNDSRIIPAKLECGALSSAPEKRAPFTQPISISYSRGILTAERVLMSGDGKEMIQGSIDALGRIELVGKYDNKNAWVYTLKGQLSDKKQTVLTGRLEITAGTPGGRDCKLTFLTSPEELMAVFSN